MDGQFLCWPQKNSQEKMIQNSLSSRLCSQQIILGRLYPLILSVNYFLAQSFKILLLFKLAMKDLITDLLDLSTQPRVFQNLLGSNKSCRRSSRLWMLLEKFWIYHGFPPSNHSQLEFSNKEIHHRGPNTIWEIRLLAERNGAAIAWRRRKSMAPPSTDHRFPFLPAESLCTLSDKSPLSQ